MFIKYFGYCAFIADGDSKSVTVDTGTLLSLQYNKNEYTSAITELSYLKSDKNVELMIT